MTCSQAFEEDRAARYAGGELPDEERDAFEQHFLDCADCLKAMQAMAELPGALRETPAVRAPLRAPAWGWAAAVLLAASGGFLLRDHWPSSAPVLRSGGAIRNGAAIEDVRELAPDAATLVPRGVVLLVVPAPRPGVGERIAVALRDAAGSTGFEASGVAVQGGRCRIVIDASTLRPGPWRLGVQRLGPDGGVLESVSFALDVR